MTTNNDNSLLDSYPPEDIADAVTRVLHETVAAAIENWGDGFWSDFTTDTTPADVLRNFAGYIEALLEDRGDADDEEYGQPLMAENAN